MRLLDLVRQSETCARVPSHAGVHPLPSPADFRDAVTACPLRLVLDDALTRVCAELAYADGERLARCLDLVRLPAQTFWVEWDDRARADFRCDPATRGRAGMLLRADASGRRAEVRTFFTDGAAVRLAAMITDVDLDAAWPETPPIDPFAGGDVPVSVSDDPALASLLDRVRFRFDPAWAEYYRPQRDPRVRAAILNGSLGSVAHDMPVLFALLLLMSTRDGVPRMSVDRSRLNASRARDGKPPLLDHVEVRAPVFSTAAPLRDDDAYGRRGPRLHHVRGHLVRRADTLFWRRAHLRGDLHVGVVRSRTVTLHFARREGAPA